MLKRIIESFGFVLLTDNEYESLLFSAQRAEDKLRSIKKTYDCLQNPLVTNAKERLCDLIESI